MKFLCVFSVVLIFKLGDCQERVYKNPSLFYQNQRNEQFNRNYEDSVTYENTPKYEVQTRIGEYQKPFKRLPESFIPREESFTNGEQNIFPSFINRQSIQRNYEANLEFNALKTKQNILPDYLKAQQIKKDAEIYKGEIFQKQHDFVLSSEVLSTKSIARENEPFKPPEDVRLELQAVSPEYIQSLIHEQKHATQDRQELLEGTQTISAGMSQYPNYVNNPTENTASYQNPSAELLYKSQQALPYRINTNIFSNKPQGNINTRNFVKNLRSNPEFNAPAHQEKRYTIIHPDGRIEYIDEIESIIAKHPNYVLLKSGDILKHVQNPSTLAQLPTAVKENPIFKQAVSLSPIQTSGNNEESFVNSNVRQIQIPSNSEPNQKTSEANAYDNKLKEIILSGLKTVTSPNTNISQITEIQTNLPSSSVPAKNINEVNLQTVLTNPNETNISDAVEPQNKKEISEIKNNNTANVPDSLLSNTVDYFHNGTNVTEANNSSSKIDLNGTNIYENHNGSDVLFSNSNATNNLNNVTNKSEITYNDTSKYDTNQTKNDSKASIPDVLLSNANTSDSNNATNVSQTENNDTSEIYSYETDIDKNANVTDILLTNTENDFSNTTNVSVIARNDNNMLETDSNEFNLTSLLQDEKVNNNETYPLQESEKSDVNPNIPNQLSNSLLPNDEGATGNSTFLFKPNDLFWDKILNNTDNVFYFLFVPPKPNTKDTKTTIYPNGTTVTEIVETVTDEDGEPKILKSTTVSFNNVTDISDNTSS